MTIPRYIPCVALLAFVVLAIAPAQSPARTMITCDPCSWPYQQWVDQAKAPTPNAPLTVIETSTPTCGSEFEVSRVGCTNGEILELRPYKEDWLDLHPHWVFLHELGHVWDYKAMQPWQRERFLEVIRQPDLPWEKESEGHIFETTGANEWFADAYANCARRSKYRPHSVVATGDGIMGTPTINAACRVINAV